MRRKMIRKQINLRAHALEIPFIPFNNSMNTMMRYALLLMIAFVMASCSQRGGTGSGGTIAMGQGDLDRSRKSGDYYTRLNASKNKHLPKGKPYEVRGRTYVPYTSANGFEEIGMASWYGPGFHGKLTANGERFNQNAMTAAHKLLPFGTMVRVTNLDNGKSVIVRINDRGPFLRERIVDLSKGAANNIGMVDSGTAKVHLGVAGGSSPRGFSGTRTAAASEVEPGGVFSSGGMFNNPNNPGGLGFPPGKINRYGKTVDRVPVENAAYGASGENSTAMGGDDEYGEGVTGFISSDPNEFGDDPTYYNESGENVGTYADDLSDGGSGNYTPPPPVPLGSAQAAGTNTNENFGTNSTPNVVSEAAYGKNTNPIPYTASGSISDAAYDENFNPANDTGMNSQEPEMTPYAFENTAPTQANKIEQAPVPQNNAVQKVNKAGGTGTYYVQIGAFRKTSNATGLVKSLKSDNINSKISVAKGLSFVKAGPYPTQKEANKIRNRLREDFPECYVTVQ